MGWAGLGCSWYHFTYPVGAGFGFCGGLEECHWARPRLVKQYENKIGAGFGFCGGLEDFSIPNLAYGFPMANFDKKITKLTSITRKTKE